MENVSEKPIAKPENSLNKLYDRLIRLLSKQEEVEKKIEKVKVLVK